MVGEGNTANQEARAKRPFMPKLNFDGLLHSIRGLFFCLRRFGHGVRIKYVNQKPRLYLPVKVQLDLVKAESLDRFDQGHLLFVDVEVELSLDRVDHILGSDCSE